MLETRSVLGSDGGAKNGSQILDHVVQVMQISKRPGVVIVQHRGSPYPLIPDRMWRSDVYKAQLGTKLRPRPGKASTVR